MFRKMTWLSTLILTNKVKHSIQNANFYMNNFQQKTFIMHQVKFHPQDGITSGD